MQMGLVSLPWTHDSSSTSRNEAKRGGIRLYIKKYALALYALIARRISLTRKWQEEFQWKI
jgi:hypothetical protein